MYDAVPVAPAEAGPPDVARGIFAEGESKSVGLGRGEYDGCDRASNGICAAMGYIMMFWCLVVWGVGGWGLAG